MKMLRLHLLALGLWSAFGALQALAGGIPAFAFDSPDALSDFLRDQRGPFEEQTLNRLEAIQQIVHWDRAFRLDPKCGPHSYPCTSIRPGPYADLDLRLRYLGLLVRSSWELDHEVALTALGYLLYETPDTSSWPEQYVKEVETTTLEALSNAKGPRPWTMFFLLRDLLKNNLKPESFVAKFKKNDKYANGKERESTRHLLLATTIASLRFANHTAGDEKGRLLRNYQGTGIKTQLDLVQVAAGTSSVMDRGQGVSIAARITREDHLTGGAIAALLANPDTILKHSVASGTLTQIRKICINRAADPKLHPLDRLHALELFEQLTSERDRKAPPKSLRLALRSNPEKNLLQIALRLWPSDTELLEIKSPAQSVKEAPAVTSTVNATDVVETAENTQTPSTLQASAPVAGPAAPSPTSKPDPTLASAANSPLSFEVQDLFETLDVDPAGAAKRFSDFVETLRTVPNPTMEVQNFRDLLELGAESYDRLSLNPSSPIQSVLEAFLRFLDVAGQSGLVLTHNGKPITKRTAVFSSVRDKLYNRIEEWKFAKAHHAPDHGKAWALKQVGKLLGDNSEETKKTLAQYRPTELGPLEESEQAAGASVVEAPAPAPQVPSAIAVPMGPPAPAAAPVLAEESVPTPAAPVRAVKPSVAPAVPVAAEISTPAATPDSEFAFKNYVNEAIPVGERVLAGTQLLSFHQPLSLQQLRTMGSMLNRLIQQMEHLSQTNREQERSILRIGMHLLVQSKATLSQVTAFKDEDFEIRELVLRSLLISDEVSKKAMAQIPALVNERVSSEELLESMKLQAFEEILGSDIPGALDQIGDEGQPLTHRTSLARALAVHATKTPLDLAAMAKISHVLSTLSDVDLTPEKTEFGRRLVASLIASWMEMPTETVFSTRRPTAADRSRINDIFAITSVLELAPTYRDELMASALQALSDMEANEAVVRTALKEFEATCSSGILQHYVTESTKKPRKAARR